MPSLDLNFLKLLHEDYKSYPYFLETGTFLGETILYMEKYFEHLYTVEIKELFYQKVKNFYNGNKIDFHLGDSAFLMKDIVQNIPGNAVMFLDGHYSSEGTGRGIKDCPLYEELESICKFFPHRTIIIIDDVRLFGTFKLEDWSDINEEHILEIVKNRIEKSYYLPSKYYEKDRLILHLCELKPDRELEPEEQPELERKELEAVFFGNSSLVDDYLKLKQMAIDLRIRTSALKEMNDRFKERIIKELGEQHNFLHDFISNFNFNVEEEDNNSLSISVEELISSDQDQDQDQYQESDSESIDPIEESMKEVDLQVD